MQGRGRGRGAVQPGAPRGTGLASQLCQGHTSWLPCPTCFSDHSWGHCPRPAGPATPHSGPSVAPPHTAHGAAATTSPYPPSLEALPSGAFQGLPQDTLSQPPPAFCSPCDQGAWHVCCFLCFSAIPAPISRELLVLLRTPHACLLCKPCDLGQPASLSMRHVALRGSALWGLACELPRTRVCFLRLTQCREQRRRARRKQNGDWTPLLRDMMSGCVWRPFHKVVSHCSC